jgi:hypothetical protein
MRACKWRGAAKRVMNLRHLITHSGRSRGKHPTTSYHGRDATFPSRLTLLSDIEREFL